MCRRSVLEKALLASVAVGAACGTSSDARRPDSSTRQRPDSLTASPSASAVQGAQQAARRSSAPLPVLLDSLRRLPGEFSLSPGKVWQFSGENAVFSALFDHGDSAVVSLVDCIDRSDLAVATLAGRHVTLGVMCGMALQRMASATEYEDGPGGWAGTIAPTATLVQLREAKQAWQKVIAKRAYKVL
jgi:hypothetical protein